MTVIGCGAGTGTPTAPNPAAVSNEITISVTATGFKPEDSIVGVGGPAKFENIDDLTGSFSEAKVCGYHDTASEGTGQFVNGYDDGEVNRSPAAMALSLEVA